MNDSKHVTIEHSLDVYFIFEF